MKNEDNKKVDKNPNMKTVTQNIFSPAKSSKGPINNEIKSKGYLNYSIKPEIISFID